MKYFLYLVLSVLFSFNTSIFANEDCLECHSDPDLSMFINDTTEKFLFFNQELFENSVHSGFECSDCHEVSDDHPDEIRLPLVNCANCHDDIHEEYVQGVHGIPPSDPSVPQATCSNCHGSHNIFYSDDSTSMTFKYNLEKTCGNCHENKKVLDYLGFRGDGPAKKYHGSVHDKVLHENPDAGAPTCIDCHDYHMILRKTNPNCNYAKRNIPATCGQCHHEEQKQFEKSIHWKAILRGHVEPPVCNDCHGEHHIISHEDKDAVTNRLNSASKICNNCHASEIMMQRYGLDHRRFESYSKSYHGLAVLRGSEDAATCTSCHEVHAIRTTNDTLSSIHANNLSQTCGSCHNNVTTEFSSIEVHPLDQQTRNPIAYLVRMIYVWMIVIVIGGMFIHNLIIFVHHIIQKRKAEKAQVRYQRFRPFEVYQHLLMFLSFSILAITGFALKFPDAAWVELLYNIGMTEYLRATIHRVSAVVMIAISIIQLFYFLFTRHGRKEIVALIPTLDDIKHVIANISYHLGLSKTKPKFNRFDYGEKAEYLALIWGVIVMGASGFILWFPTFFMKWLPTWSFETFEVIHYYEAWLASLAIVVWHWFFVIMHPDNYPLNLTLMDGKITEDNQKHHHPEEKPNTPENEIHHFVQHDKLK
jgi:cytochrome b subunit of formate dehydrogenase